MFNGLNQKTTNGGVNAAGKLTSAEWNNFINELISELEKRASNILINSIRHTAASHEVNLGDIVRSVKVNGVTVAAQNDGIINLDLTNFYTKSQIDSMLSGLSSTLGGLTNVDDDADEQANGNKILIQENGSDQWKRADLASLVDTSGKFGYAVYQNGSINFYDEENGTLIQTLHLTGDIYNIDMGYTGSSVFSVLTGDSEKILTIAPTTTLQTQIGGEATPVAESYNYVVAVNTGSGYVNRIGGNNVTGSVSFDIRPWLVVGTNMVRITVTGNTSQTAKSLVLTATLTSLSLTCQHNWRTPWYENQDYTVSSIFFAGAIQKTLHVGVDGVEIPELAQTFSASENASTISKSITIPATDFPIASGEASGQHTVEIWMTGTGVETQHITYNILCVTDGDTSALVCVNNVASKAYNFAGNNLFEYYVLNADQVDVDVSVTAGGQTYNLARQTVTSLEDLALNTFSTQLEVATEAETGTVAVTIYPSKNSTVNTDGIVMLTMALDNSLAFLATSGAAFYFTAGTRSNGEANKTSIVNTVNNTAYAGTWQDMTWSTDGWVTDAENHKALALMAGTSVAFADLVPMSFAHNTNGLTVEMMLRASVVADFDTPVLQFTDTALDGQGNNVTVGVIVYPTKIQVFGSRERDELAQEVGLSEDTITHLTITWQKDYAGTGKNLCTVYVNGIPNVTFEYNVNSTFGNGVLQLGQDSTDTYLYMMRMYSRALEGTEVLANMLNAIINGVEFNRQTVRDNNAIMTDTIQYALARDKFNCFVVEPDDETAEVPSFFNQATVPSTIYFEYAKHHDWDVKITGVPVDGQGTTSKKYFRWNLRGKMADGCQWYYTDGDGETRGNYANTPTFTGKKGFMDGGASGGQHLKIERFTAKKNVASSPQGHKMGATALYDDLFTQIGLKSELPDEDYRVAVWQYPFLGFKKTGDSYEYIGLYTIGPDKGCKVTFGYDKSLYPKAMCIEGPNHAPRGTRFLHPWVDVTYSSTDETLKFGGQEGWDDDFSSVGSSDDSTKEAAILACYESEWKPAYNLTYHCSPYIAKLTEATMNGTAMGNTDAAALTAINASVSAFMATGQMTNGEKNELMSFYDENYDLYYYRNQTGKFEKLNDASFNLLTYLADYLNGNSTPTTAEIVAARAAKFKAEMGNYFSLQQTLYHKCFCMLIGAKDNDAKNTYPFKHRALTDTGAGNRWGWKQDDLDSILPTDNNGQATVKYSAEHGDLKNNAEIYQGCDSAFWTLIWRYFQPELATMMTTMMNGLRAIAIAKGLVSGSGLHLHDYVFAALKHYFFANSAKYFPELAYYYDRKYSYLDPWQVVGQTAPDGTTYPATYNNVYPLKQALGDRYQDESLWVWRRIAYIFSKYSIGAFSGTGDGWGQIAFALLSQYTFQITPAIDLYPVGSVGGDAVKGARTNAGSVATMVIAASAGTTNYINAADWLASIGDLKDMQLVNRTGGSDRNFNVAAARMETLKVGDAVAENVSFNATALEVSGPAFKVIDARNVVTITSAVDLRNCPRLRQALFGGCSAPGLLLPVGSRVEQVSFPENLQELFLHSLNQLTAANMTISQSALGSIVSYLFYKCEQLNPLAILADIMAVSGNRLAYASITWDGNINATATEWNALVALADGYHNVNYDSAQGLINDNENLPHVAGTVTIDKAYQEDVTALANAFPNLVVNVNDYYIKFEDEEVERICSVNWGDFLETVVTTTVTDDSDTVTVNTIVRQVTMRNTTRASVVEISNTTTTRAKEEGEAAGTTSTTTKTKLGMTYAQAAAVSSVGTANSYRMFYNNKNVTAFNEFQHFTSCTYIWGNWNRVGSGVGFANTNLAKIVLPDSLTSLQDAAFYGTKLATLDLKNVSSIGRRVFMDTNVTLFGHETPPTLNSDGVAGISAVYVPDDYVATWKAASVWSNIASRIHPISEYAG